MAKIVQGHLPDYQGDCHGYIISNCYVKQATIFLEEGEKVEGFPWFYKSAQDAEEQAYAMWLEKYGQDHESTSHEEEMAFYSLWLKEYMPKSE